MATNPQAVATPNPLLEKLHDFHAPDAISYWPPAPGWIILALLLLASIVLIVRHVHRRHQKNAWRRQALAVLSDIRQHEFDPLSGHTHARISQLLKQCLASRTTTDPDTARHLMTLTGDAFADALRDSSRALNPYDIHLFAYGLYHCPPPPLEDGHLHRVELWIRGLPA